MAVTLFAGMVKFGFSKERNNRTNIIKKFFYNNITITRVHVFERLLVVIFFSCISDNLANDILESCASRIKLISCKLDRSNYPQYC
jgi:hypothetical protein